MNKHKVSLILFFTLFMINHIKTTEPNPCSICLEDLSDRRLPLQQLPCHETHRFHQSCIQSWLVRDQRCPICREKDQRNSLQLGCIGCILSLSFTIKNFSQECATTLVIVLQEIEKDLARINETRAGSIKRRP